MSRPLWALKRLSHSQLAQDTCAAVIMISFILVAGFVLAEVSDAVSAARARP